MRRHYFIKEGAPVWIRIPGTPFTLAGTQTQSARLPGMTEWAPREVVERMGAGLKEDVPVEELANREANRGLLSSAGAGAAGGGILGALGGRLMGGAESVAPFKNILNKGLTRETFKGLSKIPRAAKLLPLLGVGAGLAGGVGAWATGRNERRREAQEVSKGLLSEQILQQQALTGARESVYQKYLDNQNNQPGESYYG